MLNIQVNTLLKSRRALAQLSSSCLSGLISIAILIVILFAKNKDEFWNLLFIIPLIFYLIIFQILLNLQVESILFYLIPLLVLILISYFIKNSQSKN
jgi:ABC-type multidrug transport system permease subunit